MRAVVVSPLFGASSELGIDTLRFNFRGVEHSQGSFDNGNDEQLDVDAAVVAHRANIDPAVPLVLMGFSFGADLALSSSSPLIDAYCAIAPPLRFGNPEILATDSREKQFVLAAKDEFRDPQWIRDRTSAWRNLSVASVAGANHFFVAKTEPLLAHVAAFLDRVAPRPAS